MLANLVEHVPVDSRRLLRLAVVGALFALIVYLARWPSMSKVALIAAAGGAVLLLQRPVLGLFVTVLLALSLPRSISTGTEVLFNLSVVILPAIGLLWLIQMARERHVGLLPSRVHLPLTLFLIAGLLSILIGIVIWNPIVPRKENFIYVQLAQWGIFALAALAFWLGAHLPRSASDLRRLVYFFLLLGVFVALLRAGGNMSQNIPPFATFASLRAPFWALLTGIAGAVLLFGSDFGAIWRALAAFALAVCLYFALVVDREAISNVAAVLTALVILGWLRFPRFRWPLVILIVTLAVLGVLFPALWSFAGGDVEWNTSGQSRAVLIERVVKVSMRNPITGIGPAAYRPYTEIEPLQYGQAYWLRPTINSHNNYVDLFSQVGILGLSLFLWFIAEIARLAMRVRRRYSSGVGAVYANGMLAVGGASLVIMMLADWLLPFVYNIGFPGFQAAIPVWLFMGALVALDNMDQDTGAA